MLSAIAIDDEPLAIRVLERYSNECEDIFLVATSTKATDVYELLEEHQPDLLFLDINMPKLNGITLLQSLPKPPLAIFTTAYSEYAVKGFDLNVVDYLLKPYSFARFQKAIAKVKELRGLVGGDAKLTFKQNKKLYQIPWKEVLFLNAYGDYVKIITKDKTYLTKAKLGDLELKMPSGFLKIHRSYIVQVAIIEYLEGNQVKIETEMIPIAQAYRTKLLTRMK